MTPIPATIANGLIDRISDLDMAGQWSAEVSRSMMREAKKLRDVDIAEGDMVIGMIHCIDDNVPAMRKAFKNSIAFAPAKITPRANFALALARHGFLAEALGMMQSEEKRRAFTPKDYGLLAMICFGLGLAAKARQYQKLSDLDDYGFAEERWTEILKASPKQQEAIDIVKHSLVRDSAIWQSLANR